VALGQDFLPVLRLQYHHTMLLHVHISFGGLTVRSFGDRNSET
jgi:hypothetical protein